MLLHTFSKVAFKLKLTVLLKLKVKLPPTHATCEMRLIPLEMILVSLSALEVAHVYCTYFKPIELSVKTLVPSKLGMICRAGTFQTTQPLELEKNEMCLARNKTRRGSLALGSSVTFSSLDYG